MSLSRVSSHDEQTPAARAGSTRPVDVVVATCDFTPTKKAQLRLSAGDVVYVLGKNESGWWDGVTVCGRSPQRVARGWFPQNFTRSYREHKRGGLAAKCGAASSVAGTRSNRSGGSSRRSSLAAPPVPGHMDFGSSMRLGTVSEPNLSPTDSHAPHLKQDYRFDMRSNLAGQAGSRRPSMASGWSAGANSLSKSPSHSSNEQQSHGSQSQPQQVDPLQKSTADELRRRSHVAETDKMNVLGTDEVQMIFSNIHDNSPPIWTPVPTTEGKILYYNRDYDIYCSGLPLLQSPELNIKSVFSDHDWFVDIQERALTHNKKVLDKKEEPAGANGAATGPMSTNTQSTSQNTRNHSGSRRPSVDEKSKNYLAATIISDSAGTGSRNTKINALKSDNLSPKRVAGDDTNTNTNSDSKAGIKTATENENDTEVAASDPGWWQKNPKHTLLAKEELFYHHRMDLRSWTEMRDTTLYFARKAYASFFQNDYHQFNRNFEVTAKFSIYYHNACRLLKGELIKSNVKREVRRILRQMTDAVSAISINGNLFFSSPQRFDISFSPSVQQQQLQQRHKSSVGSTGTAIQDPLRVSISTLNPLQPADLQKLSISSNDILINEESQSLETKSKNDRDDRFGSVLSSYTIQAHSTAFDENSKISIQALFQTIDAQFSRFMICVRNLDALMKTKCSGGDILPQLFPRFFRDGFSGGAWTSTFQDQVISLTPRASLASLGSPLTGEVYQAVNNVFGSVSSKAGTVESSILSKSTADNDRTSAIKGSPKAKNQKSLKFPLNEDTLALLKKRIDYFSTPTYASYGTLIDQPRTNKRNLEISANCHRELSHSVVIIEMLENLDLRFFLNMRNLAYNHALDEDSEELRQHTMTSSATLLMEFFDIKQALYDVTIKKVMDIQNLTLDDPFVFCSMAGDLSFGGEREDGSREEHVLKQERLAEAYRKRLVAEDVEVNDMTYFNPDTEVKATQISFLAVIDSTYQVVEQLIQARENVLNYAARMMKNDLISELTRGEQEKIFEDDKIDAKTSDAEIEHIGPKDFGDSSFTSDVPWYLDSEHEYSLIYDNQGRIKGGTKVALLEHLTSHRTIDASFNIAMLLSFRSIFTTSEFLHALVERYHLYPPEGLSFEEYSAWIEKKSTPVKTRVVNILKTLFSNYWTPAYYEPGIDDLVSFAQLATAQSISGAPALLVELKNRLSLKGNLKNFVPETIRFDESGHNYSGNALNPRVSTGGPAEFGAGYGFRMRKLKLLDIDPQTFAKQLTTKEHYLYSKITPFECLDRIWSKKYCYFGGSEDISKFISSANALTSYVSFAIVKQTNTKKRAKVLQHFISVAEYCYELNNFSSMTAIVSALYSSPIFRLKKSWSAVPEGSKKVLENLNTLMDPAKNFITYRNWLKTVHDVACVPFFGVYLSDLTFIAEGNPNCLHRSPEIINFSKRLRIVDILKEISSYQIIRYKFKRYDDIQSFIEESMKNIPNIEKQYEQSLRLEPRTEVSAGLSSGGTGVSKTDLGKKLEKKSRFMKNKKRPTKLVSL